MMLDEYTGSYYADDNLKRQPILSLSLRNGINFEDFYSLKDLLWVFGCNLNGVYLIRLCMMFYCDFI